MESACVCANWAALNYVEQEAVIGIKRKLKLLCAKTSKPNKNMNVSFLSLFIMFFLETKKPRTPRNIFDLVRQ